MINYARHRRKIDKMYNDRAAVTRMEKVKVGGETKLQPVKKYENQPCFLSQKALGANNQTEPVNKIAYETKLFISPDIEILQGDIIEVTRGSLKRVYTAGEPFPYPTHQEISIQRKDKA